MYELYGKTSSEYKIFNGHQTDVYVRYVVRINVCIVCMCSELIIRINDDDYDYDYDDVKMEPSPDVSILKYFKLAFRTSKSCYR